MTHFFGTRFSPHYGGANGDLGTLKDKHRLPPFSRD